MVPQLWTVPLARDMPHGHIGDLGDFDTLADLLECDNEHLARSLT